MNYEICDDHGFREDSTTSDYIIVTVNDTCVRIEQDGTVTVTRGD